MASIQLPTARHSTGAPATHSSLEGSTPVKETITTTTTTREPISSPSQFTDTPNESPPLSTHTPYPTITQPDNNTNPFRTTPSHTSTPDFALGNVSSHQDTKEKPAPGTTQKAAQNVGMLAGNVSGAGVQGAKNEYEHAPFAGEVKDLGVTDPGTTFDYSPSTEQMQDTGLSAASTAAGYEPSGEKVKEAESTAGYVPSMQGVRDTMSSYIPKSVKNYLPASVGGTASSPTTTLPSEETGQNPSPHSYTGVGSLPGPPGEKDVAVLPDDKLYNSPSTSTSHLSHPVTSTQPKTLPSQEEGHTPSTHTAAGPLPSGTAVALPPFARTHEAATTGGVADLHGTSLAKLPEETRVAGLPTYEDSERTKGQDDANRSSGGGMSMGVEVVPGYHNQGDADIGTQRGVNKDLPSAPTTTSLGADSKASTRTLPGSLAGRGQDSTTTSTSTFSKGQDQEYKTGITGGAKGSPSTASHTSASKDNEEKGAVQETKDTFAAMRLGVQHTIKKKDENQVPGMGAEREQSPGMREMRDVSANQKLNAQARTHPLSSSGGEWKGQPVDEKGLQNQNIDTPTSTRATTGHEGPFGAGDKQASSTAPDKDHPDMPTGPTKSDPTHDADATTARSPSSAGEPSASGDNNSSKKTDSASGKEKHGFMDKIKGEMKVISGKLGHDEEKVELGKQMMGKN